MANVSNGKGLLGAVHKLRRPLGERRVSQLSTSGGYLEGLFIAKKLKLSM